MIDRSYTLVTGPAGSGKTSLIEALVASNRSRWLAAIRVVEDDDLAEPLVDDAGNDETRRWEAAGDVDATLLRVPEGWPGDVTSVARAIGAPLLPADAIVIEGNAAFHSREVHAAVFVAPAGGSLLVEERREVARIDGQTALSLALGLNPADEDEDEELPYGLNVGDVIDEDDETVVEVERIELSDEVSRAIRKLLDEGAPSYQHKRWLRRDLEDLWKAHLVVIGAESPAAREEASRLRDEVLAVRRDGDLRREVTGHRYDWPRSCFVADVRDRKDEGTRKVVQAVKRRWR
ncbi:MAG: hypothetical protein U5K29_12955 [Acidimicrobiales bacterium]|nr:hypothetical protein [Acidimicrobiales bacterium]